MLGQPPVIGEILAGILLGPSLLGWLVPTVQQHLLPPSVLPVTSALGTLGLLAFLFLTGLELDLRSLRTTRGSVAAVSLTGLLLPMALGAALAAALYPHFAPDGVERLPFTLFVAVALSITAFRSSPGSSPTAAWRPPPWEPSPWPAPPPTTPSPGACSPPPLPWPPPAPPCRP
nr:cation:proton antiporter [Streptomyces halstedii]